MNATIVAALVAFTAVNVAAILTQWLTGRRERKAATRKGHSDAYNEFLAQAWSGVLMAGFVSSIWQNRSGLLDRIDTLLGVRVPVNEERIAERMLDEQKQIMRAWSTLLATTTSQPIVDTGSDLLNAVTDILGAATTRSDDRFKAYLYGEKPSAAQVEQYDRLVKQFVDAWYAFCSMVRKKMGRELILFPLERSFGGTLPRSWQQHAWDRALRRHAEVPTAEEAASVPGTTTPPSPESSPPALPPPATTPGSTPSPTPTAPEPRQRSRRRR